MLPIGLDNKCNKNENYCLFHPNYINLCSNYNPIYAQTMKFYSLERLLHSDVILKCNSC